MATVLLSRTGWRCTMRGGVVGWIACRRVGWHGAHDDRDVALDIQVQRAGCVTIHEFGSGRLPR